jgi:hypothetical protein
VNDPSSRYPVPVVLGAVAGKPPVLVMLDSGSNRQLMGYSLALALDARLIAGLPAVTARGVGGKGEVSSYWAVLPELKMGGLEMRRVMTLVAPDARALVFTRNFWGQTQMMILGVNALKSLSYVSLDYLNGQVTFEPTARYLPEESAEFVTAIPLRWEGDLPVVDIAIEGRYHGPAVVDTGGQFGLLLSRQLATELEHWKAGWGQESSAHGIAGEAKGKGYIVHRVRVGDATFRQVPTLTRLEGPEPLGGRVVLGNYELRRHRVTFDFRNNVLWLER